MFKKLLILVSIFSLTSCGSVFKKNTINKNEAEKDNFAIEDTTKDQAYQPIENAGQAEELNKAAAEEESEVEVQDRVFFTYDSVLPSIDYEISRHLFPKLIHFSRNSMFSLIVH
jgi:hypothetical protein